MTKEDQIKASEELPTMDENEWPVYAVLMKHGDLYYHEPVLGNRYNTGDGWLVVLPWGEQRERGGLDRGDNRFGVEHEDVAAFTLLTDRRAALSLTGEPPVLSQEAYPGATRAIFKHKSDYHYLQYHDQLQRVECLGWKQKVKDGRFGKEELDAHCDAHEHLGKHRAYSDASDLLPKPIILSQEEREALEWADQPLDRVSDRDLPAARAIHVLAACVRRLAGTEGGV